MKTEPKDYQCITKVDKPLRIKPSKKAYVPQYLNPGDQFTGFSKSLSKKSEYFFSELEITLTSCDFEHGLLSGIIDKKVISISGKKHISRVFFEGEIIDGLNHTFTSSLSANCESLDLYFWSRFPSFKEIDSLKELRGDHSSRYLYMRWNERGTLKTKLAKKKKRVKDAEESSSVDEASSALEKLMCLSSASSNVSEGDGESDGESETDANFELIEYFDETNAGIATDEELVANGQYFIQYDVVQNKITGYFKQAFMKNC